MEIHQLRYLVAVAEEGSFSRAAERVRVAQPSLSQQILKLEGEVGQPLFDRLPRGVVLTESGERLIERARRILADVADAQRCVDDCKGDSSGQLVIGGIPTVAPYLLPPLLREFRKHHPMVKITVMENVTEHLVRGLENGDLDLALVSTCRVNSAIHRYPLGTEPLLVAASLDDRLTARKEVSWRDLKRKNFLVLHEAHCLSRQVSRFCSAHSVRPNLVFQGAHLCTVLGMVAAGLGISVVPKMLVAHEKESGCVFLPFAGIPPERELNLIRSPQRYQTKASAAFAELARAWLAAQTSPALIQE
jgi:LysR family transcriptional regulator, hydrogen peroxide-inducible genes activator